MHYIAKYLASKNADIIALQEDFNYHDTICESLSGYTFGKYTGGFNLKKLFSSMTWFPPRFKTDGLTLAVNDRIQILDEQIVKWKKSHGYFSNANDKLTSKGFRFYTLRIDNKVNIDLYILHMDADFYDLNNNPDVSKDIKARANQFKQLVKHFKKHSKNPTIIMGDTNSSPLYEWDVKNIEEHLLNSINSDDISIKEIPPINKIDVDRVFFINRSDADYELEPIICNYEYNLVENGHQASDHCPLNIEAVVKHR